MLNQRVKLFVKHLKYTDYVFICKRLSSSSMELTDGVKIQIEQKWKSSVSKGTYNPADESRRKRYVLSMFPYPSGNLHLGHMRVYTIGDTMARFYRLRGENVFQPMGFDAFGLPAENAALERKIPAKEWTYSNIKTMTEQLRSIGFSFDWDYQVITCDPSYYQFTQYIFLLMYRAGLVYQKEAIVNWDPIDKTVLANEQVDEEGRSWRSGAVVEKKILKQWFVETTKFAYPLLKELDNPDFNDWRDIVSLQKHWIGECNGSSFKFSIIKDNDIVGNISIWTRYPEFIKDCSLVAVTSQSIINQTYGSSGGRQLEIELINPFTCTRLPVIVSDSIYYDEGTDVKLVNPKIDVIDEELSAEFGCENVKVGDITEDLVERARVCELARNASIGGFLVSSKLKDWPISRQRRWGTPIPLVHCSNCGVVPVEVDQLPVLLPEGDLNEWSKTKCPDCGGDAVREKDTMDTFVDSSWYFLRYLDPKNKVFPYSFEIADKMMPVDLYIGGKEHATLHLYYARFLGHFLHSCNYLKDPEPFKRLLVQGMVMGKTYKLKENNKYLKESEVTKLNAKTVEKSTGKEVEECWEKMSKSKHNGIEPKDMLEKYGIDTTRLFMLSDVAPTSNKYWKSENFPGILNWQKRIWALMQDFTSSRVNLKNIKPVIDNKVEENLWDSRNFYTKGISFNYRTSYQLSVAISKLQGFTNSLKKCPFNHMSSSPEFEKCFAAFIIMLAPMSPHFASELWDNFRHLPGRINLNDNSIEWTKKLFKQSWPKLDDKYQLKIKFLVNNAVKDDMMVPYSMFRNLNQEEAFKLALESRKVSTFIGPCDILDKTLTILPDYEAFLNIEINHFQKHKLKHVAR